MLACLAQTPDAMQTSAEIAETLKTSAVMVRRVFAALHTAGFIVQRKGPQGGAKLKVAAKAIGLGDVFQATGGEGPGVGDKAVDGVLKRVREDAVGAMNETSIAGVVKRMKKS